ncbi:hypothetical protein L1987_27545 [Smallanthus sonchifolius]|uniref:Uncharacterized protein n=1 Tax=Smallanthus sonchifolius TaxID=185202 RepID=A0ACB9IBC0_9ASTR|nr:hypothetical protein L1987_27545 [Smallanthus sonchifolius]
MVFLNGNFKISPISERFFDIRIEKRDSLNASEGMGAHFEDVCSPNPWLQKNFLETDVRVSDEDDLSIM